MTVSDGAVYYALYRGDELVDFGTMNEIVERHGMTEEHVRWLTFPSVHRRMGDRGLVACRVTDEGED